MNSADELEKLRKLRAEGTITDEQYERARARLLEQEHAAEETPVSELEEESSRRRPRRHWDEDDDEEDDRRIARRRKKQAREWCMILHLSLFAGHAVPLGGIVAPIVMWQLKKDEWPEVDEHGRNAANWIISNIIYIIISVVLCIVIVGFVLLIILAVLNAVFPVIAAIKANEGRVWRYPLAIRFLG